MENYYLYLVAAAAILFIGFLIGVKTMVFLSRIFGNYGHGRRRRRHRDNDYNDYDHDDDYSGQGGSFFFRFILFIAFGIILAIAFKPQISKLKWGNIMSSDLVKTEKKPEAIPVPIPTQHITPDEIPETIPAPASQPKGPQAAPKPTAAAGKFIVQLGVFSAEERAVNKVNKIQNKGIRVQYATKTVDGNEMYVVFAGPYNTREDAEAVQQELHEKQSIIQYITL